MFQSTPHAQGATESEGQEEGEDMKESEIEELKKELEALTDKWGLKSCAFCGIDEENNFVGFAGKVTLKDFWLTALNVGRLWQRIREQVRQELNYFEK